jgi:hypothetical protein
LEPVVCDKNCRKAGNVQECSENWEVFVLIIVVVVYIVLICVLKKLT